MRPATMALAYRIWGDCRMHGWDRTYAQVAESLDEDPARVRRVAAMKGWLNRFRATAHGWFDQTFVTDAMDDELERLGGDRSYPGAEAA